jgi:muconolactone delta-isomerase
MKHHEREFFISMIRSGKVFIRNRDIELEIHPLTIDQSFKSCQIYKDAYEKAYTEEIMTEDDMNDWMLENGLWTYEDDEREKQLKDNIEKLKVEIYNARDDSKKARGIRMYIRAGESQLSSHLNKKYLYHQNTCEGVAAAERLAWIIKNTTYLDGKLYNFEDVSLQYVVDEWHSHFLSDGKSRDLARNEPWRSLWITRENSGISLFANPKDTELTHNQKNLLVWSQMYDNIQESMECPSKEVIEDDDMLDGWFIIQSKKRDKERAEREFDNEQSNEKIKNSGEVFVMATDKKKIESIDKLNDPMAAAIKKQRFNVIKRNGQIENEDLPDQQLNRQMVATNQMVEKLGG